MKRLLQIVSATLLVLMATGLLTMRCITLRKSDEALARSFAQAPSPLVQRTLRLPGGPLHYLQTGQPGRPALVFVHGSPGSSSDYEAYLKDSSLLARYLLVSVDRPGFGRSQGWQPQPSLHAQALALLQLLDSLPPSSLPARLLGHSYGGPLVLHTAMLAPHRLQHLFLVAAAVDPALEPHEWYRPLMGSKLGRLLLPGPILASNAELMGLKQDLMDHRTLWPTLQVPITMLHGTADVLVPFENVDYVQASMPPLLPLHIQALQGVNHFIPWTNYAELKAALLQP